MQEEYQEVHHQAHFKDSFVSSGYIQLLYQVSESELAVHLKHADRRDKSSLIKAQLPPEYLAEWYEGNSVNVESCAFEVSYCD